MSMFCFQCQETAMNKGCTVKGVCGKEEHAAKLQDLLIYTVKGISDVVVKGKIEAAGIPEVNHEVLRSLFMTITNANFDAEAIEKQISKMISLREDLKAKADVSGLHDAAVFNADAMEAMLEKAASVGVLATENEDVRSLREMIIYGLKGMAAYAEHALNLGKEDLSVNAFIYEALAATLDDSLGA
ncbi:MAG: hydroxylamine reductase, partial [Synergistaceae bacterium]|nr:hydroxylamine reductase [Synergistaceae bacterium]